MPVSRVTIARWGRSPRSMRQGGSEPASAKGRVWPWLVAAPVLLIAIVTLGLAVPIPYIDVVAAMLSGLFAYLVPAALAAAVAAILLWKARPTAARLMLVLLSLASLVAWSVVAAQSLAFASREGVPLDVRQLFTGLSVGKRGPDETHIYTRHGGKDVTLSIWKPKHAAGKAPVLLMTHGGGFATGSVTQQLTPNARWLADRGYLVIGANYSLSDGKVHAWNVAEGQIACALAWANEHAAAYGGDVSRLAMYGESAGGNLVINVSYKIAKGVLRSPCGGSLPKVKAVSAIYPVVGIMESYENRHALGKIGRMFDEQYLGGTPRQFPDRYAAVQSANSVTPAAPPTLIIYGASDHLVPPNGTRNFVKAARKAGIPVRAMEAPHGEHSFDLVSGGVGAQAWRHGTLEWFAKYVR